MATIAKHLPKITITDEVDENETPLKNELQEKGIALFAALGSDARSQPEIGFLLLGQKKSGNPYSPDDAKILEIIADEMVIAIQNALRFEEIQQFAETLQAKVDDATRKLRRTNEKLKALG
jgi:GAF domain-containing protein